MKQFMNTLMPIDLYESLETGNSSHTPVLNLCLECYDVKQNALEISCCNEQRASEPLYHDTQWQTVICLGMTASVFRDVALSANNS